MQHICVLSREKAGFGVCLRTEQKNAILQFFLVFAVIMRYDSADTGTVCISEEWHGRVFSPNFSCYSLIICGMSGKERFKIENQLLFLED